MKRAANRPTLFRRMVRRARAFTFLEILVAVSIATIFLGAAYSGFIQMLRTADKVEARTEALRSVRGAMLTLMDEIRAIEQQGSEFLLVGVNETAAFGNAKDDDRDGRIDEETIDGLDNDGDYNVVIDDLHAEIPANINPRPMADRFTYTDNAPFDSLYGGVKLDLGDYHVDEDTRFGRDAIVFRVFPVTADPNLLFRTITYTIGSFDGQNNVLIRQARTEFSDKPPTLFTAPLAFKVMGLDFLYWDPNGNPNPSFTRTNRPYWVETWNSDNAASFDPPKLPLPASIFARATIYADSKPFETYRDGLAVETLYMQTIVNIEDTIGDALYPRPIL